METLPLSASKKNLSIFFEDIESFGKQLLFSSTIRQWLQHEGQMNDNERILFIRDVEQLIAQNYSLLALASDILIFNDSDEVVYAQGYKYLSQSIVSQQIDELKRSSKDSVLTSIMYGNQPYLGMTMRINHGGALADEGYLFVAIGLDKLETILKKGILNGVESVSIISGEGDLIASTADEVSPHVNHAIKNAYQEVRYQDHTVLNHEYVTYQYAPNNDWYIVSCTPFSYIQDQVFALSKTMGIGILLLVIIVGVVSYYLWQSIVRPLSKLIHQMKDINRYDLLEYQVIEGDDEVSYLYKEFNVMMAYIKDLIADMKRASQKERQLEIKMLQAQINPHFLFNTLNSIKWMAEMSNNKPISETIGALSRLLRSTIIDTHECVTIDEELNHLRDYLTIQKMRYGDCFTYTVDVESSCHQYQIIKFILQPIVENCLLHGLDHVDELMISIKVRDMLDHVYLYIEDNGVGFDVDAVLAQKAKEKLDGKLSSIGLLNVMDRVSLYYDERADIKIVSELNEGTIFVLKLPKINS